jgi:hypothetical protein
VANILAYCDTATIIAVKSFIVQAPEWKGFLGTIQLGLLWPCPQILRPDWKEFLRVNHLAYWASSSVTKEKSFITWTTGQPELGR